MRETFLDYNRPAVTEAEVDAVVDAVRSLWLTRGPRVGQFEAALADYLHAPHVVAVNSCTAALHLALVAAGIGPGDEVVTTPITFAASVNVIIHVGATPVLADVDEATGLLDPRAAEAALTPRTRAILPVDYAGFAADLDAFRALADAHRLVLVEDAAHAIATRYRGRLVGQDGHWTAFSFYATKNLATGEGGALVCPDEGAAEQVRQLSLHGMSKNAWNRYTEHGSWYYEIVAPGFKYNMTDIQAALGLVQLGRLDALQARRSRAKMA
jgi:dTDP-4-amino-4,6-dideoxygalactose transaminase